MCSRLPVAGANSATAIPASHHARRAATAAAFRSERHERRPAGRSAPRAGRRASTDATDAAASTGAASATRMRQARELWRGGGHPARSRSRRPPGRPRRRRARRARTARGSTRGSCGPRPRSPRSSTRRSMRACGSRPEAGSSSSRTCGSCTSARARPSRCFCPRERTRAGAPARSVSPTCVEKGGRPRGATGCGIPYSLAVTSSVSQRGQRTPRAERVRHPAEDGAGGLRVGRPGRCRRLGSRRRPVRAATTSISSRVVLPEPFGPTSPVTRPGCASKLTSRTACTSPNERRTAASDDAAVIRGRSWLSP